MSEGMRLWAPFIRFPVQGQSLQLPDGREAGASISQPAPKILLRMFRELREETPLLCSPVLEGGEETRVHAEGSETRPSDPCVHL